MALVESDCAAAHHGLPAHEGDVDACEAAVVRDVEQPATPRRFATQKANPVERIFGTKINTFRNLARGTIFGRILVVLLAPSGPLWTPLRVFLRQELCFLVLFLSVCVNIVSIPIKLYVNVLD